jgi:large repetitive protein
VGLTHGHEKRRKYMKRFFSLGAMLALTGALASQAATVSGVVSDSSGNPLQGIYVALRSTTTAAGTTLLKDTTDAAGAYGFAFDSTSGKFVLRTIDLKNVFTTQYDTLTADGTDKTIAIKMSSPKYSELSGTILDSASNLPVAGAIVRLQGLAKPDTTDAAGGYAIDSVQNGSHTISVSATGYVSRNVTFAMPSSAYALDVKIIKIKYSTLSGTIIDSAAALPVAGAIVRLQGLAKPDTTDATGKYAFDSLQAGAKSLSVSAAGFVSRNFISVTMPDSSITFDVKLGKIKYSTLSGTIADSATALPIAGAIVRLGTTKFDTTDAAGLYSFDSLTAGARTISVSATGYITRNNLAFTMPDSAYKVNVKLIKILYGSLSGLVLDSATGQKIVGAIVRISSQASTTDTAGFYSIDSLQPGMKTVTVTATGFAQRSLSVTISDTARVLNISIIRLQNGSITGTVVDAASGGPIAGVYVILFGQSGDYIMTDTSGITGKFAFNVPAFGNYLVEGYLQGFPKVVDTVALTNSTPVNITLRIVRSGTFPIAGAIIDTLTGARIRGAFVIMADTAGRPLDTTLSDTFGIYHLINVSNGNTVTVSAANYYTKRLRITGTPGTLDTQLVEVYLWKIPMWAHDRKLNPARETISLCQDRLIIGNFSAAGTVRLLNLKGEVVFDQALAQGASAGISLGQRLSTGSYILKISRKNGDLMRRIFVR